MSSYILALADRIDAAASVVDPKEFAMQLVEDGEATPENAGLALCAAMILAD